jgi:hypothetical protein
LQIEGWPCSHGDLSPCWEIAPTERLQRLLEVDRDPVRDGIRIGEHRLLACLSRQLAETLFKGGSLREIVAGKLPATPKAFGACAPQN